MNTICPSDDVQLWLPVLPKTLATPISEDLRQHFKGKKIRDFLESFSTIGELIEGTYVAEIEGGVILLFWTEHNFPRQGVGKKQINDLDAKLAEIHPALKLRRI